MPRTPPLSPPQPFPALVLFDGDCSLCNGFINFVIDRDPEGYFGFAALQSDVGRQHQARHLLSEGALDTMLLIEHGLLYRRSTAALRILRRLSGAWPLLYALRWVPRVIRDRVYDAVARNRYRWFGRQSACRLPTPELQRRFL